VARYAGSTSASYCAARPPPAPASARTCHREFPRHDV